MRIARLPPYAPVRGCRPRGARSAPGHACPAVSMSADANAALQSHRVAPLEDLGLCSAAWGTTLDTRRASR